jgi:GNAT superfamily N-acetyltransferase
MDPDLPMSWASFASLCVDFYAAGLEAERVLSNGWFAALSRTSSAELNVCGLSPKASDKSASDLAQALGADQPGIVFTSEHVLAASRHVLTDAGFTTGEISEPLMRCGHPPEVVPSTFSVSRCETDGDLEVALRLTSEAHTVDIDLLDASIGQAARVGAAHVWLAHDGEQPVSTVWICRSGSRIGVMEMMTPKEHQGRGAGRAVLTTALAATWSTATSEALLLATPAGRPLYESVGFEAIDECLTCYRGVDDSVLEAIGQAP